MNKGVLYGFGAYFLWGILPVYWKWLHVVPALQIVAHRVAWSLIFVLILVLSQRSFTTFKQSAASPKTIAIYTLAACLVLVNWLIYIWAVNANFIVETSLGYFINPLVNVLLGVIFLREKLRPLQWVPVGLAGLGVLYLTIGYGSLPWIALALAFTFGLYGLVKKTAPLESLHGLTLETAILFLPAVGYLAVMEVQGSGAFGHLSLVSNILLVLTGVVTATPLLLFGAAARRVNLSTLGILQYIAPTCQFLIGVLVYREPFTPDRLVGFSMIWLALLVYWVEGLSQRRRASLRAVNN